MVKIRKYLSVIVGVLDLFLMKYLVNFFPWWQLWNQEKRQTTKTSFLLATFDYWWSWLSYQIILFSCWKRKWQSTFARWNDSSLYSKINICHMHRRGICILSFFLLWQVLSISF